MSAMEEGARENLGKWLGELTRDAREAKRIAEEMAEAARLKAEREMLIRVRGDDLFGRCVEEAEKAALQGDNFVTTRLPVSSNDVLLHLEIGQFVVHELIRCGCRAELYNEELSEETRFFRVQIGWDVPEAVTDQAERVHIGPFLLQPAAAPVRQTHALGAVALTKKAVPIP